MSEINLTEFVTIMELAMQEHNKQLLPYINVLGKRMDMFADASWQECNDGSNHKGVRASTEPTGSLRAYDEGISTEAATSTPYSEPTEMLDGLNKIDAAKLRHRTDPVGQRARQDAAYMAGMLKTFMTHVFYGDRSVDGKRINGITVRSDYNTLSSEFVYDNADGNASVTANKTSIFLIGWGTEKFSFTFPQNDAPGAFNLENPSVSGLGIRLKPMKADITQDSDDSTKEYLAFRTWLEAHFGIVIHDPRYLRRIGNISTTNIDGVDDFSFDEEVMIDAVTDIPDRDNAVFYTSRIVFGQMWKRTAEKGNVFHLATDPFGKEQLMFATIPIHMNEQIVTTEATLV